MGKNYAKDRMSAESKKMIRKKRNGVIVADLNDRPGSIRPSHRDEDYETEKLGMPRHKYVDPDFAMTREEEMQKVRADNKYLQFIRTSYENRIRKKDTLNHFKWSNSTDIGIQPGKGLKPLKLHHDEIEKQFEADKKQVAAIRGEQRLMNTRELKFQEDAVRCEPVQEGLNAQPTTNQEVKDCKKVLTPKVR